MNNKHLCWFLILASSFYVKSQNYWQQSVDYKINVDIDVKTFKYNGDQILIYSNNSPDTLNKVFYHLYFNAFQPGSEMAARIVYGKDKNKRFKIDFNTIPPEEEGWLKVSNIKQDGKLLSTEFSETILDIFLELLISIFLKINLFL